MPDNPIFRVDDIHGRHIVVTPISDVDGQPGNLRLYNIEPHRTGGAEAIPHIYNPHSREPHPRMGRELYSARHNSVSAYIEFPIPPVF